MAINIGASMTPQLLGLHDELTGDSLDDWTVTFTLSTTNVRRSDGTIPGAISGANAVSMPYVTASTGNYYAEGNLTKAVTSALAEGSLYYLFFVATDGTDEIVYRQTHVASTPTGAA